MIPGDRHKIHLNAAGSPQSSSVCCPRAIHDPAQPARPATLEESEITALKVNAQSAVSDIKLTLTRSALDDDDHWPGTTTTLDRTGQRERDM